MVIQTVLKRLGTMKFIIPLIERLSIKITSPQQEVESLSDGKQQKVSIAKWLAADCHILIIDEPTIGVDAGVKEYIYDLIWDLAKDQGKFIILISSDLPEMLKLARRILVFQGQKKIQVALDDLSGDPCHNDEVSLKIGSMLV